MSRITLPDNYNRTAYTRGWRHSQTLNASLDTGDAANEPDEWYDGYLDYAAGREKWHIPTCHNHSNDPEGCGVA